MKKKELVRGIIFLILAALIFQILTTVFIPKWYGTWQSTRIVDGYYELPENSLDVVLLGSSQTIMGLSPMELYKHHGISAYSFGTEEQPMYATYYWLKEILRTHTPKVVVLDVNELIHTSSEAAYRKAFDYMEWSEVKWEAIKTHCDEYEELSLMSYVLPLTNYHSRWDELEAADITYLTSDKTDPYLGFVISHGTCEVEYDGTPSRPEMEADPADPEAYAYLQKIIQLCKEEKIQLLFVKTPRAGWNPGKHNLVVQIAQEAEVPFLDFNDKDIMAAMQFDYMADARDGSHLNIYGAEKVGAYLGDYLTEHYELPDRRGDSAYAYLSQMEALYDLQAEDAKLATCEYLEPWLDQLQDRYILYLAVSDGYLLQNFPETIWSKLQSHGLNTATLQSGADYTAIVTESQIVCEQSGLGISDVYGTFGEASYEFSVWNPEEGEEGASICSIRINRQEYAIEGEGLHMVVYDPVDEEVIDSICVDMTGTDFFLRRS